ncbi:MAG: PQ-loop repeat-containing protein [Gammaproteobacteria bacterium]|nr:PQ-loop repeat-containing protein [Gammaproteobacteria bacterium]
MNAHMLGEITLSISTVVYFIWFLPQIWLNFKRKSTKGLSLWMHGLLLLGYCADLLYGFGREMQWQYRMVTITGLFFLLIQHYQFWRYSLNDNKRTRKATHINFILLSSMVLILLFYAVFNFTVDHHSKQYYDIAGFISDICWMTYLFPQIIKNYLAKSVVGLSVGFVVIDIILSCLDMTSTFALHWDWPSVVSAFITLFKKGILVSQIVYYRLGATRVSK